MSRGGRSHGTRIDIAGTVREGVERLEEEIKPRLRGWLHLGAVPLAVAAGVVLVALSPDGIGRVGAVVFAVTSVLLFTMSAVYHTGTWAVRTRGVLQRIDHATIFLLIAGTYTPFALLSLDSDDARVLLAIVWASALLGIRLRALWTSGPRWAYVPIYVGIGWASAFWLGDFATGAGIAVFTLMLVGGLLYSLGAMVFSLQRPNPLPRWFGFHEVFHSLTIVAFGVHYVGISMATYALR